MWPEIVTGGAVVGLVGIIIKLQNSRIAKKVDKIPCSKEHEHVNGRLKRGEEKFDKFDEQLKDWSELLIRVDERVAALARKNGV